MFEITYLLTRKKEFPYMVIYPQIELVDDTSVGFIYDNQMLMQIEVMLCYIESEQWTETSAKLLLSNQPHSTGSEGEGTPFLDGNFQRHTDMQNM